MFGKKKKGGEGVKVGEEGGGGKKREEVVVSSGDVEVVGETALVEVAEVREAASDISSAPEGLKLELEKKEQEQEEQAKEEDIKKLELIVADTPLVAEPSLPSPPPPPPQQLVLTPESIANIPIDDNKSEPTFPFSPVEISQQIRSLLASSRIKPDADSELAPPPPNQAAHLLALLGRPEIMNGGDRDKQEEDFEQLSSVWKCLEHFSHDSFCSIVSRVLSSLSLFLRSSFD